MRRKRCRGRGRLASRLQVPLHHLAWAVPKCAGADFIGICRLALRHGEHPVDRYGPIGPPNGLNAARTARDVCTLRSTRSRWGIVSGAVQAAAAGPSNTKSRSIMGAAMGAAHARTIMRGRSAPCETRLALAATDAVIIVRFCIAPGPTLRSAHWQAQRSPLRSSQAHHPSPAAPMRLAPCLRQSA